MAKSGRGGKVGSTTGAANLEKHFERENARVEEFMSGKASSKSGGSIEMDNGQILERYTNKEMLDILKESKENGTLFEDDSFAILYNDGNMKFYTGGDDISKVKTTGIQGVIYENGSTTAYSGKGVKIENLNQTEAGAKLTRYGTSKYEDDWRMDFTNEHYDYYIKYIKGRR